MTELEKAALDFFVPLLPGRNFCKLILTFWSDFQAVKAVMGGRSFAKEMVEKAMG